MAKLNAGLYDVDLIWKGTLAKSYQLSLDPNSAKEMRATLLHLMRQYRNDKEPFLKHYAMRLRPPNSEPRKNLVLLTYTAAS